MSYNFPEGAKFLFSPLSTFAAAKTVTAMSNANPCSVAAAAHGLVDGDEALLQCGWEDANDTIFRIDQTDAANFLLLDFDTSDTGAFSPGGGVAAGASVQKVGTWLEIPQVLTIANSGGDPRYTQVQPLSRKTAFSIPVGFNPSQITLTLGHDPANAVFKQMLAISRATRKVGFKLLLNGGAAMYGFGYMAVSDVPALNAGQVNQVSVAFAIQGRVMSYAGT